MSIKATGIIRKVDELGRIVIPMELRRTLGINEHDPLEIFTSDKSIILRPYKVGCLGCGEMRGLVEVSGISLCPACVKAFERGLADA